jgi:hypothetical protein
VTGPVAALDCQACGACCINLPLNQAAGVKYWVEIEPEAKILGRPDLLRKLVVRDRSGVPHLRLEHDGRCASLRGPLGGKVSCAIYHQRPGPCRRVQAGDASCLRSRQAHGLDPVPDPA